MTITEDSIDCIKSFLCKVQGLTGDHNYVPTVEALFNVEDLSQRNEQHTVNLLWTLLEDLRNILENSGAFPAKMKQWMDVTRPTRDKDVQTDPRHEMIDQRFVQVTCDKSEVDRRIAAFIKRKRAQSDAFNRREFCQVYDSNENVSTCARTDAVFVTRQSEKSLVKIKRIVNTVNKKVNQPAKTEGLKSWHPSHPSSVLPFYQLSNDTRERFNNLNKVVNPKKRLKDDTNVYQNLRDLEDRVLYLETLSPEYFNSSPQKISKNIKTGDSQKHFGENLGIASEQCSPEGGGSVKFIDMRIEELKERLRKKAEELKK